MNYTADEDGYVKLGPVASHEFGMQTQYASYYLYEGMRGYPYLGEGLRLRGLDGISYHDIEIHIDDIPEFVRRMKEHRGIPQDS